MGADDIARVRDRIAIEHADLSHGVQGVDAIEASSLIRSALASGVSQRDIAAAIRQSTELSSPERTLLNHSLEDAPRDLLGPVPPQFGLPLMGSVALSDGSTTTRVSYSGIMVQLDRDNPDPRFGSALTGFSVTLTNVSGTDSAVRVRVFDCALAAAYGLDADAVRRPGSDERAVLDRLLALPDIASARTTYSEDRSPLRAQERCFIPTPNLPMLARESSR